MRMELIKRGNGFAIGKLPGQRDGFVNPIQADVNAEPLAPNLVDVE